MFLIFLAQFLAVTPLADARVLCQEEYFELGLQAKLSFLPPEVQRQVKLARNADASLADLARGVSALRAAEADGADGVFDLVGALKGLEERFGQRAIDEASSATAARSGAVVLLRGSSAGSAAHLAGEGVGKSIAHKFHSATEGVIAGLVPRDQSLSGKVVSRGPEYLAAMQAKVNQALAEGTVSEARYQIGPLVAVKRAGKVVMVDETTEKVSPDEVVWILVEKNAGGAARPIASDIDPLAFGFPRGGGNQVASAQGAYGWVTPREKSVVDAFNQSLAERLGRPPEGNVFMTHGAEARNPSSAGVDGYPIRAYFPSGEKRSIEMGPASDPDKNLRAFYEEARRRGFDLPVNPRWHWPN